MSKEIQLYKEGLLVIAANLNLFEKVCRPISLSVICQLCVN